MEFLLLGAIAMGSFVAGLFFLRSWKKTGDRLFLFFAISFFLEGANRFGLVMTPNPNEADPIVYIVRFVSFLLIIIGIVDKNRPARTEKRDKISKIQEKLRSLQPK
jgi:hypothetical protein